MVSNGRYCDFATVIFSFPSYYIVLQIERRYQYSPFPLVCFLRPEGGGGVQAGVFLQSQPTASTRRFLNSSGTIGCNVITLTYKIFHRPKLNFFPLSQGHEAHSFILARMRLGPGGAGGGTWDPENFF